MLRDGDLHLLPGVDAKHALDRLLCPQFVEGKYLHVGVTVENAALVFVLRRQVSLARPVTFPPLCLSPLVIDALCTLLLCMHPARVRVN